VDSGVDAAFVPDYSGGPAPDFNGIPNQAPQGTTGFVLSQSVEPVKKKAFSEHSPIWLSTLYFFGIFSSKF